MRRDPAPHGSRWTAIAAGMVAVYGVLIALTASDYGITRDEAYAAEYGDHALAWYASGFRDREVLTYRERGNYAALGAFFEATTQAVVHLSPFGRMETRHVVTALYGLLAVAGAFALAYRLAGPRVAAFAVLLLLLTPRFYGHSFNNPKDIPFAALYIWALYTLVRILHSRGDWRWVLAFGVIAGLTLGIRVGGLILWGYAGLTFLAVALGSGADRSLATDRVLSRGGRLLPRFLVATLLSYVLMIVFWPAAQVSPIAHPLDTIRLTSEFPWNHTVFFEGSWIRAHDLPPYYVPKWLSIALPELLLLGLLLFVGSVLGRRLQRRPATSTRPAGLGLVALAALFPPAFAVLSDATVYDGMRHFLFIVPPLAVLGAAGISDTLEVLGGAPRIAVAGIVTGAAVLTAVDMIRLHPYQTVYFNRLVAGGLPRAAGSYETDYWGNAYRSGAAWIDARYALRPIDRDRRIRIASCFRPATLYYLDRDRFRHVELAGGDPADLFIASTRWECHLRREGRVVHTESRMGVPLLYVKELPGASTDAVGAAAEPEDQPPRASSGRSSPPAPRHTAHSTTPATRNSGIGVARPSRNGA